MKKTLCQIGDLHREFSVADNIDYLVVCRELCVIVSEHRKIAAAWAAKARKQPHWVQKIYNEQRLLTLYVYRRIGVNTFEIIE